MSPMRVVMNALIAADFQKLLEQRNVCFDGTCTSGISAIVLAVGDFLEQLHRDHAACTHQASSGPLTDAAITLAVRDIVLEGLQKEGSNLPMPREVMASLVSGAIYGAVKQALAQRNWSVSDARLEDLVPVILPLLGAR